MDKDCELSIPAYAHLKYIFTVVPIKGLLTLRSIGHHFVPHVSSEDDKLLLS